MIKLLNSKDQSQDRFYFLARISTSLLIVNNDFRYIEQILVGSLKAPKSIHFQTVNLTFLCLE
jgi:hypothetical protein